MRWTARWFAIATAVVLLAASCGDDDPEPVLDPEPEVAAPATTDVAPPSTIVPPTPTDPPRADPPMVGDLIVPCGRPGDAGGVGVDDDRIVIGVGNDRGGLHAPGSGRGVVEAVRALADYCNSLGGIAGRQLIVEEFDAAVIETDERMAEACAAVFSLVGHAYLRDDLGEGTRLECGLPAFPAWSPGVGDDADLLVSAVTSTPIPVPLHGNFASLLASPLDGSRIALVGPDTAGGRAVRIRRAFALLTSGLPVELVADIGYEVDADPDWPSVVAAARRAGTGVVYLDGSCRSGLVPFLRAAADAGWDPAVVAGVEAYDPDCIDGAEGVSFARLLVEMPFLPADDGDVAPATAMTVEIFDDVGVPVTGDSLRAASAFWLWAVAAESCGAALDRACVVTQARSIDEWTAGGLHAATDPGTSAMEPCVVLLAVEDGTLVRRLPTEPGSYDCEPLG